MDWTSALLQLEHGTPVTVGVALLWSAWQLYRTTRASLGRFGERIGALEQGRQADQHDAAMERARRWQLEAFLIAAGDALPPWPDHPAAVAPPTPRHALPPRPPVPTRSQTREELPH